MSFLKADTRRAWNGHGLVQAVAISVLASSAIANFFLVKQNARLQTMVRQSQAAQGVTVGQRIKSIAGVEFKGTPLEMSLQHRPSPLVVLVYTPQCNPSNHNWQNWEQLVSTVSNDNAVLFVDLAGTTDDSFVRQHNIGMYTIITSVSEETRSNLHLAATPQTIVIGRDGVVQRVWTGALSAADIKRIQALLLAGV